MLKRNRIQGPWVVGALFVMFVILAWLFPYTGDDWDWGSSGGMQRLQNFFAGYNGRYLGNLLVILLTRSKLLRVLTTAAACVAVCVLCNVYAGNHGKSGLLLAVVLFFAMPREMFVQSVAWTSGMVNYIPSTVISVGYLCLVRNISGPEDAIRYPEYLWAGTLFLGLCGGLFVENTTLFNVCLAVAVIGYTWMRTKRFFAAHIGFLVGALISTAWMFSNSAYHNIAQGEDFYRTTPQNIGETVNRVFENTTSIFDYIVYDNKVVCLILGCLVMLLVGTFFGRNESKTRRNLVTVTVVIFLGSLSWILFEESVLGSINTIFYMLGYTEKWIDLVQSIVAVMFYISMLALVWLCVDKGCCFKMTIPLLCIPIALAPLIVVYPIGPRCVFIGYILMLMFILCLWRYLCPVWKGKEVCLAKLLCTVAVVQCLFYVSVYLPAYSIDRVRSEFVKQQVADGADVVYICPLPNEDYLQHGTPVSETVFAFFRSFYGMEADSQLETVHYKELCQMAKNYLD